MKKKIFAITGSATTNSANLRIVEFIKSIISEIAEVEIFDDLKSLPHFDPALTDTHTPGAIIQFRDKVAAADVVVICTPEYIFSIPSGLKNAFEWCVSTTIFSEKRVGVITASAHGVKCHEELQLILRTLSATLNEETTMLIQGIKGKVDLAGKIMDKDLEKDLISFAKRL